MDITGLSYAVRRSEVRKSYVFGSQFMLTMALSEPPVKDDAPQKQDDEDPNRKD